MSLLDKIIAAIVPEPTPVGRAECRAKARSLGGGSGWLAQVLEHGEQLDAAFDSVREASSPTAHRAAQKRLATLLTCHSIAEESVLYAAMALGDHQARSAEAYTEQGGGEGANGSRRRTGAHAAGLSRQAGALAFCGGDAR